MIFFSTLNQIEYEVILYQETTHESKLIGGNDKKCLIPQDSLFGAP